MLKSPRGGRGPKGAIIGGSPQTGSPQGSPHGVYPPSRSPVAYNPPMAYPPPRSEPPITNMYAPPEHLAEQGGRPKPRIKTTRRCRDIPFLVIFVAFLVGMIINSSWGWNKGNPKRLLFGIDYKGHLCSDDYDVRYWMNPNQVYDSGVIDNPFKIINARSICLKSCPSPSVNGSLSWICDYPEGPITLTKMQWVERNYDYYDMLTSEQQTSSLALKGFCCPELFQSRNFLWSCQLRASANNQSLQEWQQLGGASINEGDFIVQGIHDLINKPAAILKVEHYLVGTFSSNTFLS